MRRLGLSESGIGRYRDREASVAHEIESVDGAGGVFGMVAVGVRVASTAPCRRDILVSTRGWSLDKIVPGGVGISADDMGQDERHGYQRREHSRRTASLLAHEH